MKKAILFGASGFIGSYLLEELLNDPDYEQVTIVVRKDLKREHPKLKQLISDIKKLPNWRSKLYADDVYIAIGTTRKQTPNLSEYYRIDHDYPLLAAQILKDHGAQSIALVSAVGADANSNVFYIKTKGAIERDIKALGYRHTHIFRPSMLMGNRKENRPLEKVIQKVWKAIDPVMLGKFESYRGIEGQEVARAMIRAVKTQSKTVSTYHWREIKKLLTLNP